MRAFKSRQEYTMTKHQWIIAAAATLCGGAFALAAIPGVRLWGRPTMEGRVPTFAITIEGQHPDHIAARLAERDIFVWSGHFYAIEVIARLGLEQAGGLIRIGLCHYNTAEEVDRLLLALREIVSANKESHV